jgi:hypothetical protein
MLIKPPDEILARQKHPFVVGGHISTHSHPHTLGRISRDPSGSGPYFSTWTEFFEVNCNKGMSIFLFVGIFYMKEYEYLLHNTLYTSFLRRSKICTSIFKIILEMGCSCSRNVKVRPNKDRFRLCEPIKGLSMWYKACRDGDDTELTKQLPFLTYDQLNRIEPNGSTCLHVACYRNHYSIVLILLICGYDRNIKNKYGLTPLEETTNDEIRELFTYDEDVLQSVSGTLYSSLKDDMFTPNNKFIMGHVSLEYVYDAKEMIKAYRSIGLQKMFMTFQINRDSYSTLRGIVDKCIPSNHEYYDEAKQCLDKEDPFTLIKLYTLQTDFYRYLQDDNAAFTVNIFINLAKFQNRAFQGRSYRGVAMPHFDVNAWKWATKQPGRLIESQTFMSTSESEELARSFVTSPPKNKLSVLFILDFPKKCDTAIKLNKDESKNITEDLSEYSHEKEILITPYTLFKVESVNFDKNTQWYQIHIINVPIVV